MRLGRKRMVARRGAAWNRAEARWGSRAEVWAAEHRRAPGRCPDILSCAECCLRGVQDMIDDQVSRTDDLGRPKLKDVGSWLKRELGQHRRHSQGIRQAGWARLGTLVHGAPHVTLEA